MPLVLRTARFVRVTAALFAGLLGPAGSVAMADTSGAPSKPDSAEPAPPPPNTSKKQRYVVAAIGDSLTDARSHGGKYLDYLRERCPKSQFDNYGKGGQMVNQMRKRFARDVLGEPKVPGGEKPNYTHVIVFGGVNDLYSDLTAKRTPEKVAKDLLEMFAGAKRKGARVIAMTVAPWGGFKAYYNASRGARTLELNQWILAQKKAGTVDYVIDTYPMLSCGDPEQLCPSVMAPFKDGLHFGPEGHAKIGQALHTQVFADCM
ncbi:MAG: GDSL-type esterase/lipase family protein [Polyangiaceae bacterium]|nr:GDSL-type esterase/lipase family protein [Polyangiaceae bacterium]